MHTLLNGQAAGSARDSRSRFLSCCWNIVMFRHALFVVLLSTAACSACSHNRKSEPPAGADVLIVPPGATTIRYDSQYDGAVSYQVRIPYPADSVIQLIRSQLEARRWSVLDEDIYNPGTPTSTVVGWTEFSKNDAIVHAWHAQWQNRDGAVIVYDIRYDPRAGEREQKSVALINAVLISPRSVTDIRKSATQRLQRLSSRPAGVSFLNLSRGQTIAVLRKYKLQQASTLNVEYLTHVPLTDRCALQQEVRAVWEAIRDDPEAGDVRNITVVARSDVSGSLPEYFFYERTKNGWSPTSGFRSEC
jgi:hypothetical protein